MPHPLHILLTLLLTLLLLGCRQQDNLPITGDVSSTAVQLNIAHPGVYQVTLRDLHTAGLKIDSLDATNLSLSTGGTAVPYYISGDQLIFYGQAPTSRYTATRPYILSLGEAGQLMTTTAVTPTTAATLTQLPQTLRLEENHEYLAEARRGDDSDLWFWQKIDLQQKAELSFSLPSLSSSSAAVARLHLWGISYDTAVEGDHDIDFVLNGQNIATIAWDGQTYHTATVNIPPNLLKTGNNSLTLDNTPPGAVVVDIMALNWLELDYMAPPTAVNDRFTFHNTTGSVTLSGFSGPPTLFDISDPAAPRLLTGWECGSRQACLTTTPEMHIAAIGPSGFHKPQEIRPLRTSDWANPTHQADLIILTTDTLASGLDALITARQEQGLTVALVPVAEIYDEFGYGAATPDSILVFLQHASTNWQDPKPRYLLLVGDATSDYRNYLGNAPQNIIPPFMIPVEFSGETVSDGRLVDIDGDLKPDLAVGRWPVDTVEDVQSLASRTLAYEQSPAASQALFATDGTEAQFADIANRLAANSNIANMTLLNGATAGEVIAQWNQGAWLTTYVGHGSVRRWGKEDVFNLEAVPDLQTTSPSFVIQLTCLSGLFAHPNEVSLTEEMMRHSQGPVLHIAATSLTLSSSQEVFATNLFHNLQDPAYTRVGDAVLDAKRELDVTNRGLLEISDTFTLFGDPSALIMRPTP